MKGIFKKTALAAALVVLGAAGSAKAATGTVAVTATVLNVCTVTTTGLPEIAFGNLDPSVGSAVGPTAISAGTVAYNCTKGSTPATYTIAGTGSMTNGTDLIAYTLTPAPAAAVAGAGFGAGTAVSVTINGDIAAGAYNNASAGAYSDTVTVTVLP